MDMISSLPNEIIIFRILSLLTTKEAFATSILSKRWTDLCHFVPNIYFTNITVNSDESNSSFNKFVYSVLASRDAVLSGFINSFRLDIQYGNPNLAYHLGFPNIIKWLNHVVQRRPKCLRLKLVVDNPNNDDDDPPKLPISTLTCKTLVTLRLCGFLLEGLSFTSIGIEFPLLRTLRLKNIEFTDIQDFMLLLAACPILENLLVSEIYFPEVEEDSLTIQKVKSLSLSLPKLVKAKITCFWCSYFPMKALSNSECLCIDAYWFEDFVYEVNHPQGPYGDIPIFLYLTHLKLYERSWEMVAQALLHCPKVQHLELYEDPGLPWKKNDEEYWVEPEFVPECLLSCLRTCTIGDFSGLQSDLELAKYILKNSRFLETMKIRSKTEQPDIERKLSPCPKASTTCKLLVY